MRKKQLPKRTLRLGVDTGGTFTDFIALADDRLLMFKVPSTPAQPEQAILQGITRVLAELGDSYALDLVHGTTVATNALLERKGARTALVTTASFEDVLEIGRQARPDLYNLAVTRPAPLVPAELRFGVNERIAADGTVLEPLNEVQLRQLAQRLKRARVESIAISLLFGFAHPDHEKQIAASLAPLGIPLSIAHEILPEYREYERTSTVVINAYLAPRVSQYLNRLTHALKTSHSLRIMQSSGGSISAEVAAYEPVRTILSGPAGGVIAASVVGQRAGFNDLLTFDMGGTSTDVALIAGAPCTTREAQLTGLPIAVPTLDIHTVGAGGGSLAYVDAGGALRVGPQSAGADPGPACYGKGTRATVTDANCVLGRFADVGLLDGIMPLDAVRAASALDGLATAMNRFATKPVTRTQAALGVLRIANANMERALRLVSIERGYDPRRFTLVSFGGAGGLHAVALAEALRIPRILVPHYPGAFSALGVLLADVVKDYAQTMMLPVASSEKIPPLVVEAFAALTRRALRDLRGEGFTARQTQLHRLLALRYRGQSFDLELPAIPEVLADFHRAHQERYGHSDATRAVEIVSVRLRAVGLTDKPVLPHVARVKRHVATTQRFASVVLASKPERLPVFDRAQFASGAQCKGACLVLEYGSTTLVPVGWQAEVDADYNLILQRT
ncbi:MAG: hydantoinase/oxoprolinase family protein [Acidobacteria bacterium]|nr:hydantoinase/oxoprolinase family protein [Acidobacteriota bacterium]